MTPAMLRKLWSLIETTQASMLMSLDDDSLAQWLIKQLTTQLTLNGQEADLLSDYISSRSSLIRDLAESRIAS